MAAAVRTRNSYSPVSVEDNGQDRLLRADSRTSVTKPRRGFSIWMFLLLMIGLCVLFLLGFCLGFYVRESQTQNTVDDILATCEGRQTEEDSDALTQIHDDIMYRVRGENIRQFMENFTGGGEPVSGSVQERRLRQTVRQLLQEYMLDDLHVQEHDVRVTTCDPHNPNLLQIKHRGNNTVQNIALRNDGEEGNSDVRNTSKLTTEDWRFPFVVHSPAGSVEGSLLYGHYGTEADLLVLQDRRVSLKGRLVLVRLGRISLAEKVQHLAQNGAAGVLVYWDPADAEDNPDYPTHTSYVPYASAAIYSTESYHPLEPTIPVQTVSTTTAAMLLGIVQEEEGVVEGPSAWSGGLSVQYVIGRRYSNGSNLTVGLYTYNKEKRQIVQNIISNIHGTVEKDRYVVIGAPRASLPGTWQDAVTSTALLLQVARSLNTAFQLKQWKPRRGIKIVSWGGADLGNLGMLHYMKTHHHLLLRRALAYFDVSRLVAGTDVLTARVSPGLYQVVNEVTMTVPDPKRSEHSIQSSWQDRFSSGLVSDPITVPLSSYHSDRTATPFLHALGITTICLQYRHSDTVKEELTVSSVKQYERQHHYKYHTAVARLMLQILLSMVDDDIVPYSISGATGELVSTLWQTSHTLSSCSKSMQDLDNVVALAQELQQTATVFEELIDLYRQRKDLQGYRTINDVKLLFDRIFVTNSNGIPRHILYPSNSEGTLSYIAELCDAGDLPDVWDAMDNFSDALSSALTEAISALRTTN